MTDANGPPPGLTLSIEAGIAWIVAENAQRMNAWTSAMWASLPGLMAEAGADPVARVIVLRGAGDRAFSAGADISEFDDKRSGDAAGAYDELNHAAFAALTGAGKPTIAMIHGFCLGGGLEVALACHWRIATRDDATRVGFPEVKLGIIPGGSGTQKLSRLIGLARAIEFVLRSRIVRPEEALVLGLVHEVADDALARAREIAAEMAQLPPLALAMAKRALYDGFDTHLQAGLRIEDSAFLETMLSDDGLSAMRAYLAQPYEKRRAWLEGGVASAYEGR